MSDYYIHGTKMSLTTPESTLNSILCYDFDKTAYISFIELYLLSKSFENEELQRVLNQSWLNPLHGKYIELYLRWKGIKDIKVVDGVFLLDKLLKAPVSHFFYGTDQQTLDKIKRRIEAEYPDAVVCGYKAPPRFTLDQIESDEQLKSDFMEINKVRPNIVWVGLGGIKQDMVMNYHARYLDGSLLIGVGAVFDYFAGNLTLSSDAVKNSGFRWLHRLIQQPVLLKKLIEIGLVLISLPFRKSKNEQKKLTRH